MQFPKGTNRQKTPLLTFDLDTVNVSLFGSLRSLYKKRTLLTTWKRSFLPPKKPNCQSGPFFDLLPVPFIEERTLTSTN